MESSTTYSANTTGFLSAVYHKPIAFQKIAKWINRQQPVWENNRLAISAAGIFIQVSVAATMIAVLGMAGAPVWVFTFGILLAFLANSLAFAQCSMKIEIGMFLTSIIINASLAMYYVLKITGY